jgi:predicted TIM-barrel fold metal-dependent hydrolase
MKLSAIPSTSTYPWDIGAVIKRLADAYGPDRMIYGGGFGADATPQSYQAARERARSTIAHFSAEDQAKVLGGTAAKLFGFAS